MSSLLMDEHPLVVSPRLAEALGSLDEAVILQQLHYWLQRSSNKRDGRTWVYNSMATWLKQFPWVKSRTTLTRHFDKLKKLGLVLTANYNRAGFDKTIWYSIDYDKLNEFAAEFDAKKSKEDMSGQSIVQNLYNGCTESGQWTVQNLGNGVYKNCTTNTRDYTETTQETTADTEQAGQADRLSTHTKKPKHPEDKDIPFKEIIDYLNQKAGKSFKANAEGHRKYIRARWKKGYRLDDFKKVIDNKCADWLGVVSRDGQDMTKYLQPKTLFTEDHFDNYLNENSKAVGPGDPYANHPEYHNLFDQQWSPTGPDDLPF